MVAKKNKPLDRRVRRTRRRLRDALIRLILEQGYERITIQNITDAADLSRATFYLHYKDKDDLLVNSLEEMFDELVASLKQPIWLGAVEEGSEVPVSVIAFRHVAEYAALYKALLLGERGVTYAINRSMEYLARVSQQQIIRQVETLQLDADTLPVAPEVIAWSSAGALFTLILWWLENDMPYTPEDMAHMHSRMLIPMIMSGLGQLDPQKLLDQSDLN